MKEKSSTWWPNSTEPEDAQVAWVRNNTVGFRSLDPADERFDDLQPLKAKIGNARVVLLGEQTHYDGTCFLTKVRFAKFLHQEMDFDVLAFESGLFECREAWNAIEAGKSPRNAARLGLYECWANCRQVIPLFDYIGRKASTARPLELAGIDWNHTGRGSHLLPKQLDAFLKTLRPPSMSARSRRRYCRQVHAIARNRLGVGEAKEFGAACETLIDAVERPESDRRTSFWAQVLRNLRAKSTGLETSQQCDTSGEDSFWLWNNLRDSRMAKNLDWFAHHYYPDRKIIVWAANSHILRNPRGVEHPGGISTFKRWETMGHQLYKSLGANLFSVMFTAAGGEAGGAGMRRISIPDAPSGTLEDIFRRANVTDGVLSLRHRGDAAECLDVPLPARPFGHEFFVANWCDAFDAVAFNHHMERARTTGPGASLLSMWRR